MKILDHLKNLFPEASNNTLRKWLANGRIAIDDEIVTKNLALLPDQQVLLLPKKAFKNNLTILYEDKHLIVVEKPAGLLTVASDNKSEPNLHAKLKKLYPKVWPMHRLDRDTSGILVFALSEEAEKSLNKQFAKHSIYREYYAILHGKMKGSGTWKNKLKEDANYFVREHPSGELSITHFYVVKAENNTTHVKLILKTGKKNQIRVQAASAGYPVVGDKKYGNKALDGKTATHLLLHASKLGFTHPISEKELFFISPIPFI